MDNGLSDSNCSTSFLILFRDHSRGKIFYEDGDYHKFLNLLRSMVVQFGSRLHAYVLLPDHIQLLVSSNTRCELSIALLRVMKNYVSYFNFTHRRIFRTLELEHKVDNVNKKMSLVPYYRYIESIPVTAGIVNHPADYPWSSYGSNALGENIGLISEHESYMSLGSNEDIRWSKYRASFDVM